jgi:hypothetical protein
VTRMLKVAACQLCHPVAVDVLMKARDRLFHALNPVRL